MSSPVQVYTLKTGEGAYRTAAVSGLLTGVAAATASAGHLFAIRWAPSLPTVRKFVAIQRLRARMTTVAGFTAAQETGLDAIIARTYASSHTGGTAVTLTGSNAKKRSGGTGLQAIPTSAITDMRIGDTGALTAVGPPTFDAQPIARATYAELAAAATVASGGVELLLDAPAMEQYPVVLAVGEGLVIRNAIAMGAGGTARLVVEVDWLELNRY